MVQNRRTSISSRFSVSVGKLGLSLSLSVLVVVMVSAILISTMSSLVDSYSIIPNGRRPRTPNEQRLLTKNNGSRIQRKGSISRRQVMKDLFITMASAGIVSLPNPVSAGAENLEGNVNEAASSQEMTAAKMNDLKKQKEEAKKKEKNAARIARETKQRLAAGRIGTI